MASAELEAMWRECEQDKKSECKHCPYDTGDGHGPRYCSWAMGKLMKDALVGAKK